MRVNVTGAADIARGPPAQLPEPQARPQQPYRQPPPPPQPQPTQPEPARQPQQDYFRLIAQPFFFTKSISNHAGYLVSLSYVFVFSVYDSIN